MKKLLFILPLFGILLSSCEFSDFFRKETVTNQQQEEKPEQKEDDNKEEESPIKVESITLKQLSLNLEEGESTKLAYTIQPENADNKTVTWKTSNSQIATVINGNVNAIKAGMCTITVTTNDGNKTSECEVTVTAKQTGADLGVKTIKEVKEYITKNPVSKNEYGNGVNKDVFVTIKGLAVAKIDLLKSTSKFGLDVSEHGKIILADSTGTIGVASQVNNQGTSLWGKIGDNVCKSTSKYIVTGYISEYLGHPELLVKSFTWDQTLDISIDYSKISSETISLTQFYEKAQNTTYNCAGHAYGEVVTIKNLKCYYVEADGQGKRYYNFTDGNKNIRVNAFNISNASEGNIYNVTGIISLKNLSPIIVAFHFESANEAVVDFNYETAATSITISALKNIHGSQEDTNEKYPDVISCYGNFYKTTAYFVLVEENGKYYVGISETARKSVISGKTNAMTTYNVLLIKNNNFWNVSETQLANYNPYFETYIMEETPIDVYFVTRQLEYSSKKPMWEILLVPESIPNI